MNGRRSAAKGLAEVRRILQTASSVWATGSMRQVIDSGDPLRTAAERMQAALEMLDPHEAVSAEFTSQVREIRCEFERLLILVDSRAAFYHGMAGCSGIDQNGFTCASGATTLRMEA